jgi:transposase-like protein
MWWLTSQKNGVSAVAMQRVLGWGSYQTAWTCLHKLRRAMIRPGRERLAGVVEVDESYLGGGEHGVHGRHIAGKALVVVAAEEDGRRIGRIRLRHIPDASAARLIPFIEDSIEPGSTVHTDGWSGYLPLRTTGLIPYQQSKGPSGAGFRVAATRPSGLFVTEAVVVGNAPGSCRRGTSSGLSKRIRVPLQPPPIAQPRQTLLPLGAAGRRNRTNNLQTDRGLGYQTEIAQTQPVGEPESNGYPVKAIAAGGIYSASSIAAQTYTITLQAATPTFSPNPFCKLQHSPVGGAVG